MREWTEGGRAPFLDAADGDRRSWRAARDGGWSPRSAEPGGSASFRRAVRTGPRLLRPAALAVLVLSTTALGQEATPLLSRVTAGLETLGAISLTPARTQGGLGGGVHAAFAFDERWQAEAHAAWLWGLGSHTLLRAGVAWQRSGLWRPKLGLNLALGLGGALDFSVGERPPSRAPTLGLLVSAALLRFQVERVVVSALELEAGASTELVAVGPRAGVTLLSLGVRLGE